MGSNRRLPCTKAALEPGTACTRRKLSVNAFSLAIRAIFILASTGVSHANLAAQVGVSLQEPFGLIV